MGLRQAWRWWQLGRQLSQIRAEVEREESMGFDWRIALRKGAASFCKSFGGLVVAALIAYINDPIMVGKILADAQLDPKLVALVVPLVHTAATLLGNWWKHRAAPES